MNVTHHAGAVPIKAWTDGVPVESEAMEQVHNLARMPFVHAHVALMPDVHLGIGATVGSVIATTGAVIPAAVGVDIGCGMMAVQTNLTASDLPDNLSALRSAIEAAVPHGRTDSGGRNDAGAWRKPPERSRAPWAAIADRMAPLFERYPALAKSNAERQIGTLGTGNHFIEACLDEAQNVWLMLHSGSRGFGNRIGGFFIELAKKDMQRHCVDLPERDLAYLSEGSEHFDDYLLAVACAQDYARTNREVMMVATLAQVERTLRRPVRAIAQAVNCHHNYVNREHHFGSDVLVTRKGAVSARVGELGIIPGSMGAKSFIVRGKGHPDSFHSCSHGAGRTMSRTEAKRRFSLADHQAATAGVECRKDAGVIDETPAAYKPIEAVMAAQSDLVEIMHTLKQVVCVKG